MHGKMSKLKISILLILMMLITVVGKNITYAADASGDANKMNVVFVLDTSGSMNTTDNNKWRFEAVELFMGIAAESGNYMGAVIFNENVVYQKNLQLMDGKATKEAMCSELRSIDVNGWTDIGKAIEVATQMLQTSGDPSLESHIILLSDGNTAFEENADMDNKISESDTRKQNAIDAARKNGYKIHSVCLNADGTADASELSDISAATGGTFVEVRSAEDLKEVFSRFYGLIYSTNYTNIVDTELSDTGELEVLFTIPAVGVSEANVIISSLNTDTEYRLYNPDGIALTDGELNQITVKAKTFSIIKIQQPKSGDWKLVIKGVPRDRIKVDMVYNANLKLVLNADLASSVLHIGDTVNYAAHVENENVIVPENDIYNKYPITLHIVNSADGQDETLQLQNLGTTDANGNIVGIQKAYTSTATYKVYATMVLNEITLKSNEYEYIIENQLPVWSSETIDIKKTVMPFGNKNCDIDLNDYVSDAEDSELNFSLKSTDSYTGEVSLNNNILNVELTKDAGSVEVYAIDSAGGTSQATINIKTVYLKNIILVAAIIIVLIVLMILLIAKAMTGSKKIRGKIVIRAYNEDGMVGNPRTYNGSKGKNRIKTIIDSDGSSVNVGYDYANSYFIAGENSECIYLVSKRGYYANGTNTIAKKIRINGGIEVKISDNEDYTRGIRIRYMPNGR